VVEALDVDRCLEILERTPRVLGELLAALPAEWTHGTEGPETWSPYDVVGHLVHGERTDWIPRAEIILGPGPDKRFKPFDRTAHFRESAGRSLDALLDEFGTARRASLVRLREMALTETDLDKSGVHPAFGPVTLRQLLAAWVAHDLDHIVQISRVMARQVTAEAGPWREYMRVLRD
jgi:hypothetical protein